MRRQLLIPGLALPLLLTALTACVAATDGFKPWVYQIEPANEQIERHGNVTAQIRLEKPVFSGSEAADAVNGWLSLEQELKLAAFRDHARQRLDDMEFNGEPVEERLYIDEEESCKIFYNDGVILSIVIDKSAYFAGEPHPAIYRYAYNFDAATGKFLALEDIWGGQAREKAAREIYARIENQGQANNYYPDLAHNLLQGLDAKCWYMDSQNVYIVYNPYTIAPYAAGTLEFALPK